MASNSFNNSRTSSAADGYVNVRFNSRRMNKLDAAEKEFAEDLLVRCGGDKASILDAPCGSGRFTSIFLPAEKIEGVDFCENMLKTAATSAGDAGNISFQQGDVGDLQFDDETFDGAFCMRLFHHIEKEEDIARLLGELHRVTKSYVAVSFYRTDCLRYWRKKIRGKMMNGYPISSKTFIAIAARMGLVPAQTHMLHNEAQTLVLFKKELV
jgi:ubiquinone/menaquinone biosynthesis C-methylase UbiE